MAKKDSAHVVIQAIKKLASQMGRAPNRDEFRAETGMETEMRSAFENSYSAALHAAGFTKESFNRAGSKKPREFKYTKKKLQGFTIHEPSLETLFKRAGNPDVLKMVCQPDTHTPHEDPVCVKAFLKFFEYYKPDVYTIMGDFGDFSPVSHWGADDFKPRRLVPDMIIARKLLDKITAATPTVTSRFFIEGNHEDWLRQALVAKIPEIADGLEELGIDLSVRSVLGLEKHEYEFIPLNEFLKIGKALFTHGLYTNQHHAFKTVSTMGANVYYGHLHDCQRSEMIHVDGLIEAASLGCWSQAGKFLKGKPHKWSHAIGVFEFFPDGTYTFACPKLINGRFSYDGRTFDGNTK